MHPENAVDAAGLLFGALLRIDHALLSPSVAERLVAADPDREERNQAQPSDHVPVVIELT